MCKLRFDLLLLKIARFPFSKVNLDILAAGSGMQLELSTFENSLFRKDENQSWKKKEATALCNFKLERNFLAFDNGHMSSLCPANGEW